MENAGEVSLILTVQILRILEDAFGAIGSPLDKVAGALAPREGVIELQTAQESPEQRAAREGALAVVSSLRAMRDQAQGRAP